jgi:hypothetical protein
MREHDVKQAEENTPVAFVNILTNFLGQRLNKRVIHFESKTQYFFYRFAIEVPKNDHH